MLEPDVLCLEVRLDRGKVLLELREGERAEVVEVRGDVRGERCVEGGCPAGVAGRGEEGVYGGGEELADRFVVCGCAREEGRGSAWVRGGGRGGDEGRERCEDWPGGALGGGACTMCARGRTGEELHDQKRLQKKREGRTTVRGKDELLLNDGDIFFLYAPCPKYSPSSSRDPRRRTRFRRSPRVPEA